MAVALRKCQILTIDRTKPFDPSLYGCGPGSSITKQDQRSLELTKINLDDIEITKIHGYDYIDLDVQVLQALLSHPALIPEPWLFWGLHFKGTTIRNQFGRYSIPHLHLWKDQLRIGFSKEEYALNVWPGAYIRA